MGKGVSQSLCSPTRAALITGRNYGATEAESTTGKTNVTLPDALSVGFYHQIGQQWAVMADVQWTHWSLLQNVTLERRNGALPTVIPEHWRDTAFVDIGARYQATDSC
jgi:long-chain fatty acid transport protein